MRSYEEEMRAYRAAVHHKGSHLGVHITDGMSERQRRRFSAPNVLTPERVERRKLGMGAAVVEVSYGRDMNGGHLWGVTVFDLCYPDTRDHALSGAFSSAEEVAKRLDYLNKEFPWEDPKAGLEERA